MGKVSDNNKAPEPAAAVGKTLSITISPKLRLSDRHMRALGQLKPGSRVVVEVQQTNDGRLTVMELLRKAD